MNTMPSKSIKEFKFENILNIFKKYKWSIMTITLITVLLSYTYIYFKTPIYLSYSIIKVKANEHSKSEDFISNTMSTIKSKSVLEEISLLKTYRINNDSLTRVNFKIQYFIDDGYKKVEIFGSDLPIEITDIEVLNKKVLGKMFTILPNINSYTLKHQIPYKSKIKQTILKSNPFTIKKMLNNQYGKIIENDYFKLTTNKKINFTQPIYFVINGEKRDIFQKMIQSKLMISQLERDTSLIKISFQDNIPERANLYVNALTKSFINYSIENKNTQNNKTLTFITEELENIKKELKSYEKKLERHQVSKNIVEPSIQASLYIRNLSDIEIEISENNLKKKLITNLINFVQNNYSLDAIAPSVTKLDDANTLALITKLQNYQIDEEELTLEYTDEYPKLRSIRKQILNVRNKIEYNLKSLHTNIGYENSNLIKRKASYEKEMNKLPSKERELVNIKRNYEVKSKMYEYLLKKQSENKILQLATFSNYHIIDHAYNSNIPIKPKKSLILILGIFLGLLIGGVLALIRHARNSYIQSKDDIELNTTIPLYASIPYYKQAKNKVNVHKDVKSPFSESFRTLRTNLQFMSQKNKGTTILISSTVAGEGKSTTVANLATILEMAKYKTIVINFDLRKPTLHKFFDIPNDIGIADFLNGNKSLDEIIKSTEFAHLDIIPSGRIPSNPSELILSKQLPLLFEKLKELYDYVIVDTAPIGIVSDTKTLIQHSDLNLILVREDYARKEFISTIEELIQKHNFKNVGFILNAAKAQGGEYGYGYSYEYK